MFQFHPNTLLTLVSVYELFPFKGVLLLVDEGNGSCYITIVHIMNAFSVNDKYLLKPTVSIALCLSCKRKLNVT